MNLLTAEIQTEAPEPFSVSATVSLQERRYHTIKAGDTFGVFDRSGDIVAELGGTDGLYHRDTRHLSGFDLALGGLRPLLLSSSLASDNLMLTSDLSNAAINDRNGEAVDQGLIHVQRSMFLATSACHGRLSVRSFAIRHHTVQLALRFEADFADLFEVRGMRRDRRGDYLPARCSGDHVTLSYRGLDGLIRTTRLAFEPAPKLLTANAAVFNLELEPGGQSSIFFEIACTGRPPLHRRPRARFLADYVDMKRGLRASSARAAAISSDSEEFDDMVRRSMSDLRMLITEKPSGPYPYAGIPWFSTAFGRDGLITALFVLPFDPAVARGVLLYLAQEQATEFDPTSEAEPGKILHETRAGEMAELGEVPFRRYYGSVDATPLFVMLAGAYLTRTGDLETLGALWPNIELALAWIDRRADGDGFVRYRRSTDQGLANQGWKDSYDAISHADGTLARGAIALCEVQGYVYAARLAGAAIARQLGFAAQAMALEATAEQLRQAFEARFWCERLGTYVLALDEDGQCQVRASNAGHLLLTGIADPARARRVAEGLMDSRFFTGWGIRTLAADEARYNPMSYHNGSVWPHDNALIALGMARKGLREETLRLFDCLRAASAAADLHRLPELFCGFSRRPGQAPTSYPVACTPQAWAAAAIPALVQACLGLSFDVEAGIIRFDQPDLPPFLNSLSLHNLSLGEARVSVLVSRTLGEVGVSVLERHGAVRIVTTT
ncbi:MAG TPA: glycogen debranching N-terminal domain-containing protein [Acetobacteraceae bacterium]|jgi:glycogen debranching enzyme|nr:glycogen debranching N-terminal domain-containing protein [Acetobacteraceae bacterium]